MDWLIDTYLSELRKIRDLKTIEKKEHLLKHLTGYTDNLVDFDRREVLSFYEHLKEKELKETTIRDILREVKLFYEWLRDRGYSLEFDEKAVRDIYRAKNKKDWKKRKYYTDDELETILGAIRGTLDGFEPKHPIYYLLTIFLVSSGLRLSEALAVKRKDIRIKKVLTSEGEEKEIWFVKVREGKFGKEREALVYFFRPEWKTLWEKWLSQLKPDDYIFTYTIRYPKSTRTLVLKQDTAKRFFWELERKLKEKGYEIEVNAHRFRNTYITKLATAGFPVNLIAEWAGHSKISTTMDVYMEAEKEKQMEVIVSKI